MSSEVKVRVRVGEAVRFPGRCARHLTPATDTMPVRHRVGRRTRIVDVPVCPECAAVLRQESGAEERRRRLTQLLAVAGLVAGAALGWWLVPAAWMPIIHLAAALTGGLLLAASIWTWGRRGLPRLARPEKQAAREAVRIVDFSWRAMTFAFSQDDYAREFSALNKNRLMPA